MKIAIIGAGISGLTAARLLHPNHDITVFESAPSIGGHTNTVDVQTDEGSFAIDTGFIVFNDRTYPNFIALLDELGVASQPTTMSFSVKCERTGLEYRGADLDGLFAQRRNIFNPRFYRLLFDLVRFNKLGHQLLEQQAQSPDALSQTVGSFLSQHRFSDDFVERYFLPMGAAIWSASFRSFRDFPIEFICEFYKNHGLLGITNRPQWRVIQGGSRSYLGPLTESFSDCIRTNAAIESVQRQVDGQIVGVRAAGDSEVQKFDHVVFGCHSDQALKILGDDATATEREILSAFPYQPNTAILHTQSDVLPKTRRAWASWNYFSPSESDGQSNSATVTYNMNILQSIQSETVFCVTLNDESRIRDENILGSWQYHHPTFNLQRKTMQARHAELLGANATSFCGAYWGNGFHEDGVKSGIAVAEQLNQVAALC